MKGHDLDFNQEIVVCPCFRARQARDVKKFADAFVRRWETAPQGEAAMGPSKTIGFIAIVLLVILVMGYALGDDGTAPTAAQLADQQR